MASVNFLSGTVIPNAWAVDVNSLVWGVFNGATTAALARTALGLGTAALSAATSFASSGLATASGLTQSTGKLLGRTTASTGAIEEITPGAGLLFASGGLSSVTSATQTFLGSDIALNNTGNYFNVCNTGSIGASGQTWLIIAQVLATDTAGAANINVRIWDGSSVVFTETSVAIGGTSFMTPATIMYVATPSAATTYTLSAKDTSSTSGAIKTTGNAGTANKATSITAIRIL